MQNSQFLWGDTTLVDVSSVTLVPFWANVFSTPACLLLIVFPFMRHRHQILCSCWLTPAFAPLIISLRYFDVNNVGITYLVVVLRSTRLTARSSCSNTQCIGHLVSWQHTISTLIEVSTQLYIYQHPQNVMQISKSAAPCVGSYLTAYANCEVIVILSRGYRLPFDQSSRTCQHIRSSQKRQIRQPSGRSCVVFSDRIVYSRVLSAADARKS
jgi:hypothetical protein